MITPVRLFVAALALMLVTACDSFRSGGDDMSARNNWQSDPLSLYRSGAELSRNGQLGEAAVAFTQGLEIAHEKEQYLAEGLCARGLYQLYEQLFDGSNQVKYASVAYDSFCKSGDVDQICYAEYDLASAYNNAGRYTEALSHASEAARKAEERGDTRLVADAIRLSGLSLFASGSKRDAVDRYMKAYSMDSTILTANDRANLMIALSDAESYPESDRAREIAESGMEDIPFEILARRGQYEEAYRGIEKYKSEQDSVLSTLLCNNVADALSNYRQSKEQLRRERLRSERLLWSLIFVVVVGVSLSVIYLLRRNLREKERQREMIIKDAEYLRADLSRQIETNGLISESVKELFRQKYAVVDTLCSAYYESRGVKLEKKRIVAEVERILRDLTADSVRLDELAASADQYTDGVYTAFRRDFPRLRSEDYRLFLYLMAGFSARSISLLLDEKIEVVYNRKSRLKARIRNSGAARKEEYLAHCDPQSVER